MSRIIRVVSVVAQPSRGSKNLVVSARVPFRPPYGPASNDVRSDAATKEAELAKDFALSPLKPNTEPTAR